MEGASAWGESAAATAWASMEADKLKRGSLRVNRLDPTTSTELHDRLDDPKLGQRTPLWERSSVLNRVSAHTPASLPNVQPHLPAARIVVQVRAHPQPGQDLADQIRGFAGRMRASPLTKVLDRRQMVQLGGRMAHSPPQVDPQGRGPREEYLAGDLHRPRVRVEPNGLGHRRGRYHDPPLRHAERRTCARPVRSAGPLAAPRASALGGAGLTAHSAPSISPLPTRCGVEQPGSSPGS
jgi:hypothetical protein